MRNWELNLEAYQKYTKQKFNIYQLNEIRYGLGGGIEPLVDVRAYADPKYSADQMFQIRLGLMNKVNVNIYADPKFDRLQMQEIRLGLRKGLDVDKYADPKFDNFEMKKIRQGLENKKQKEPEMEI